MRLALFQPDIPQNTGALMRIGACFRVPLDIIEPCGFPFDDRRLRRTAMDYGETAVMERHASWEAFLATHEGRGGRLVLLTTSAIVNHGAFSYAPDDTLLLGRESAGVPSHVTARAEGRVRIPMADGLRSLNVAVAGAIVLAEALRQTGVFAGKLTL
ncbi:MAG: tRNA (cytidine(34)-2'-O)-methyltransferase [Rhodospirillaceae bacterium]|nr:MAG: tRNA (cytidine(34)-2'-O)-methyltransferase [Rhodospirillaceae bacterium]